MAEIKTLFITQLYRAGLDDAGGLNADLKRACLCIAKEDAAGRAWSAAMGYQGYTSYASLNDLTARDPAFAEFRKRLDRHAAAFSRALNFELAGRKITLDSMWINVLKPGGSHTGHIHPHSVLSGTYYVDIPKGASALKLEDPRLPLMMAAPPRREGAPECEQTFVYVTPHTGEALIWESWLRHEVTPNGAKRARISVSFNYRW